MFLVRQCRRHPVILGLLATALAISAGTAGHIRRVERFNEEIAAIGDF